MFGFSNKKLPSQRTKNIAISLMTGLFLSAFLYKNSNAERANPQTPMLPRAANLNKNDIVMLIRTSLIALDQANNTGNYSVLRDLSAPNLQQYTTADLGQIFLPHRKQNLDLSGVVVIEPMLTILPQIESDGRLHFSGFFPSAPNQIKFDLYYQAIQNKWKISGLTVSIEKSGPIPPSYQSQTVPKAHLEEKPANMKPSLPAH